MEIVISELDYCKIGIKYQASPEDVKDKRYSVAKEMAKTYDVKGFRKGRATPEVIKASFPKELDGHLKQEMLNKAYSDTLTEKGLKPFGGPSIESASLEGDKFECSLSVHTLPEFELKEYKGFDIPKYYSTMSVDQMSQQILQELRMERAESVPYVENDRVQIGDQVVVQYHTTCDGVVAEKLSSENGSVLEVGRINVPGFDQQLLGMAVGEEREFTLTAPVKDFDPDFFGKELTFKLKLTGGSKKVLAGLDDELAKKIGLADFAELMVKVNGVAGAKVQGVENGHYQLQVSQRLIGNHDFMVPSWISLPEAKIQSSSQKKEWDTLSEEEKAGFIKGAEEGVKLSLVLEKIREEEPEAQLSDSEVINAAKTNLSQYTQDVEKVMQDIYEKNQMPMFLSRIRDEHILAVLISKCNIVE